MPTLRSLARPGGAGNSLMAAYQDGLRRHWGLDQRLLARLMAMGGLGGWSAGERALLADPVRQQGLSMADRKGLHRLLNPGAFPFATNPLKNKQLFARRAQAAGLPIADACDPDRDDLTDWLAGQHDIIAKPSFRSKGQGVERFERRDDSGWHGATGMIRQADLVARLIALWGTGGVIQQRVPTHDDLVCLSPGALPTLRVVTCLNEQGAPEACALALRVSAGGPRPVDNFNAGNLVLGVDAAGQCGPARLGGGSGVPTRHDRHPVTDAAITGRAVPDLDAAVALAIRAHDIFRSGFTVIGWDVGLAVQGPVLVEGNWNPGTDIIQLVTGQGLADSRLGALYRHHLAHLPAARWRAARAIEREARRA